ncbi:MAG: tetratricopeptide repeat protein, partial [Longimicrobiaceae bacterium]
ISLRYQGRLREALATARRLRSLYPEDQAATRIPPDAVIEAQVLFELGRGREAAALFDSLTAFPTEGSAPARIARHHAWMLTHAATALAAAGDTAALPRLADSIQALGRRSAFGRDRRLHHHVRGLLLSARGQPEEAVAEFRRAIFSSSGGGYTRSSFELGRLLVDLGRPREAIAVLQPALRGPLDAANLYLTRTELHELLGRAFEAAGQPDSAAAHYQRVVTAWDHADPEVHPRQLRTRLRLRALAP